ncbi:MAG: phosphoribosylanthranilate isomerase [Thermodesulfobacteria bacterium]|nr:phosphoribosylanthranilate isomerase [Thermodesulfobacteriota bacterium]
MVKVKICGITNKEDFFLASHLGADYLGFIFYSKSPRHTGDKLKELLSLETNAKKVVVFVNPEFEEVKKALDFGADFIQLHGSEPLSFAKKIGLRKVIKAFRIKDTLPDLFEWKGVYAILFDTYVKGEAGGTGKRFNWNVIKPVIQEKVFKIFLAGGINPKNVLEAIKLKPYAIDISSGVEASPGKKDPKKLKLLFELLKKGASSSKN